MIKDERYLKQVFFGYEHVVRGTFSAIVDDDLLWKI